MRRFDFRAARALGLTAASVAVLVASASGAVALSLDEAVRYALRQNINVYQALETKEAAQADMLGAASTFYPDVRIGTGVTRSQTPAFDPQTQNFSSEFYSATLRSGITFFDGGYSRYKQAKSTENAAELSFLKSRQNVVYETERLYFDVLKEQKLLEVQTEAVGSALEQLKKTEAMRDLGAATQADVLKAEVEHANNVLEELRKQRDVEVAKGALATYIGLNPIDPLVLQEEDPSIREDITLEEAAEKALRINPRLESARESLEARKRGVTAARAPNWPDLVLSYEQRALSDDGDYVKRDDWNWTYGAQLNWTLFDGFLTKSNIRRAQSSQVFASRALEDAEREVLFQVRQAHLDFQIASKFQEVSTGAVASSEEDLRLAQERYKIGEGTILDVIVAQVNLTRARSDLVTATYEKRLAASRLRNAIGDIFVPEVEPAE